VRTVRVIYRQEPDGAWIGTSAEIPGFVGYGDTYEEARDRVNDGLGWFAEEDLQIAHMTPVAGDLVGSRQTRGPRVSFTRSRAATPYSFAGFSRPRTGQ
jgi:predicted RNase H-like HicB family nuclease